MILLTFLRIPEHFFIIAENNIFSAVHNPCFNQLIPFLFPDILDVFKIYVIRDVSPHTWERLIYLAIKYMNSSVLITPQETSMQRETQQTSDQMLQGLGSV